MMSFHLPYPSEPEHAMFLPPDTISLTPNEVQWAKAQSQIASATRPWQIYLNALSRLGFQHWLEERSPELLANTNLISEIPVDELCEVSLNHYRVYMLATDSVDDSEFCFSQATIDTRFNPHFYVLVEVFEEIQQVHIYGYLPQAQLIQHLQAQRQQTVQASTAPVHYWLSSTDFDPHLNRLLLCLTSLEPSLGTANPSVVMPSGIIDAVTDVVTDVKANAINAALWINNQLDQLAESLSWVLLPATPSPAMRPMREPSDQLAEIISNLIKRGKIAVPPQIGQAYQDISLAGETLRLYAVTWEIPRIGQPSGWMLLLILGTPTGSPTPLGVRLQVRDHSQLLGDVTLEDRGDQCLYVQVDGDQNEQFIATILLNDQQAISSPIQFILAEQ